MQLGNDSYYNILIIIFYYILISLSAGMNVYINVEDILVFLIFSIIISWTFRILAHEENQYSYACKILGTFVV